jgi:tetratricopeptide (TPR) repeat protein
LYLRFALCLTLGLRLSTAVQTPALPANPQAPELQQARSYAEKNMLKEAETETRRYLAAHQDSAPAHFLLGYVLFRQQKARESLAEMTTGAKFARPSAADLRVVGSDYVLLADYSDADKWFSVATEWDPQNVLGWYYLARTKYNENRFEEAVKAFEQTLKLDPRHVRAEDNLGLTLQALGKNEEARQAFLNAIDWQTAAGGKDPWPYIDFGSFLIEQNQPEQAIPLLQKAVVLLPDSPKARQALGKAYLAVKQLDKAQEELEAAVKLEPESARAHYVLGQLYSKQGLSDKAKVEFARYSELNAKHPAQKDNEPNPISPQ